MLNNVPTQINRSARLVTLRHPNAIDCTIWRKTVNRVTTTAPAEIGGLPTIEGVGVLDSEDEADYEYAEVGDAKIVFTGQFQTQGGNWRDDDSSLTYNEMPVEALIECVLEPSDPNYVVPDKPDLITVTPGPGIVLTYEVIGETSSVSIPPYVRKFALAPRQDSNVGI